MKLNLRGAVVPLTLLLTSVLIVVADYLSGPAIQFPVLFLLPVALGSWYVGFTFGGILALLLPLTRVVWLPAGGGYQSFIIVVVNTGIRIIALGYVAYFIDLNARRMKELKVLKGLLPICGVCKKIRNEKGEWQQVEMYISGHSEARFSHGLCPTCARQFFRKSFP